MKHGKKYTDSKKLIDNLKQYDPEEAVTLVKQTGKAKFDETIELSIRLGVDPRHADQQVRGTVVLPHGTGKKVRVLVFAKGEIRTLVAVATLKVEPKNGLNPDVYAGIPLAQAEAEWAADELKAPLLVLVEGRGYTGDPTELRDIRELECNRVAVVIGDTEKHDASEAAAVGLLAGRLAAIPVQRSAARVRDGAVKADAMYILGDRAEMGQPEAIHDKGFICPRTFAGKAGYYWSDDLIAAPVTDDYCLIPRRRTIDKAARVAYAAMLEYVNDEIAVTAEGKIVPSVAKDIETVLEGAIIKNMTRYGNLSTDPDDPSDTGVVAYVDPDQDIVRTSHLDVTLRVRPYGYAKYIEVDLGFQTLNS